MTRYRRSASRLRSDDLPDRAGRIDDRRSCRIGHEGGERLDRAAAVGVLGQRQHVFLLGLEPGDRGLQHLDQALVEQRDAGRRLAVLRAVFGASARCATWPATPSGCRFWRSSGFGRGVGNIGDRLGRLSDRNVGDHLIRRGVDRGERIGVLKPDIDARAVARRPDAMRQIADRDGRDLREVVGAEHLDLVQCRRP